MLTIDKYKNIIEGNSFVKPIGEVTQIIGLVIEADGPTSSIGDLCYIYPNSHSTEQPIWAEVVGFKADSVLLMPLVDMHGLKPGARVINTGKAMEVRVGSELLGRVLDGLGRAIDNNGLIHCRDKYVTTRESINPLVRKRIVEPLPLGIKSIDGFITCGKGQRMGIFAGSGVGKSTTIGMIARNTDADINVIALIGERGREVREFIEKSLGPEGLAKSVLVVVTSDQPALLKIKGAYVATTIAEYFRDLGNDVLFILDSVTRIAMAQREVGLAIGEPPATRGYTPSVFALLPRLLERTGAGSNGTITGLYTVLVEGDDFNEPVSDTVRGILDGHIMLSRELAEKNNYPAVDILSSISRVMIDVTSNEHRAAVGKLKNLLALYEKSKDLINIGAYVKGTDTVLDIAINKHDKIMEFLRQDIDDKVHLQTIIDKILELAQ